MNENRQDFLQAAIGDWGRWQLMVVVSLCLVRMPIAWNALGIVFLAPPVHHWCTEPPSEVRDACSVSVNGTEVPCTSFRFDRSVFTETIVTQWELVCDRRQLANVAQTVYMFGALVGNLVFGMLADRYGRKISLILAVMMQVSIGTILAFIPWFFVFLLLRFLLAVATGGELATSFVICMEIVGTKWRNTISVLYHVPQTIGYILMVGFAYMLRDWHHFQLLISLPTAILLFYWCVVPESPRWLLAVGRVTEAGKILKAAASMNKMKNTDVSTSETNDKECKGNVLDLLRSPNLRTRTICLYVDWFACGLSYYGLAQYMGQIGGNIFINVALTALIGIPSTPFCIYSMGRFGRRRTLIGGYVASAIPLLLIIAVPQDDVSYDWMRVILACLGSLAESVSFTVIYLYTGELLPTVLRSVGVGSSSMFGRIGSMVAPFVLSLNIYSALLPPLVFGTTQLISGLLSLLLPETANTELPDTLEEAENIGKKIENLQEGNTNGGFVSDCAL